MTRKPRNATANSDRLTKTNNRSARLRMTKSVQLINLLKSRSGHDIESLSSKLGWQAHSTRAALSRIRKAGHAIDKMPPRKNGSGSRYRIVVSKRGA